MTVNISLFLLTIFEIKFNKKFCKVIFYVSDSNELMLMMYLL